MVMVVLNETILEVCATSLNSDKPEKRISVVICQTIFFCLRLTG
jgi:hypothetical protein